MNIAHMTTMASGGNGQGMGKMTIMTAEEYKMGADLVGVYAIFQGVRPRKNSRSRQISDLA